jgi:hypothetical protein
MTAANRRQKIPTVPDFHAREWGFFSCFPEFLRFTTDREKKPG